MIKAPKEFYDACRNMGPYLDEFVRTPDDLARVFLSDVGMDEAKIIARFIDDLLTQAFESEQLKEFWWSTPTTTVFYRSEDVAAFLKSVREVLSQTPYLQ
jgi:hypothetical protein